MTSATGRVAGAARWLSIVALAGACSTAPSDPAEGPDMSSPPAADLLHLDALSAPAGAEFAGVTPPSGNRWHDGAADLASGGLEVTAGHPVTWLVAAPLADGIVAGDRPVLWVGGTQEGAVSAWILARSVDGTPDVVEVSPSQLGEPWGASTTMEVVDGAWRFVVPEHEFSPAPVRILDGHRYEVGPAGEVLVDGQATGVAALPDGVFTVAADGRVAVPTEPTDRYGHAVLGDAIEAGALHAWQRGRPLGGPQPPGSEMAVFEARSVLWADLTEDGFDDLVITESDAEAGARVVAFPWRSVGEPSPGRIEGAPIGRGGRWRHLVAVVPFEGLPHVVEVVTPHLSRTMQVSRVADGRLVSILEVDTDLVTHTIGARDLDRAAVFDADGDGTPDLVAPTRDGDLGARSIDGRTTAVHALPGVPSSNLAVHAHEDGRLDVGIGTDRGIVLFPS